MKCNRILQSLTGLLALAATAAAQTTTTTTTGFAPFNFGNVVLTSMPSNATGPSGVSTVFTSSGTEYTLGTGGALVNPAEFDYVVTGPNSARVTVPARGNTPASTMNLVFTSPTAGTFTNVTGTDTTTGRFNLATIPSDAPIENVSARGTVGAGGSTTLGFVIAGTMPRRVLVRAIGPGLANFGVPGTLSNPMVRLYRGNQLLTMNDDWGTMATLSAAAATPGSTTVTGTTSGGVFTGTIGTGTGTPFSTQLATVQNFSGTGAFALQSGSRDAAFTATLPPGPYTVVVSASTASTTGGTSTGGTTTGGTTTDGTTTGGTTTGGTTTGGTTTGGTTTGGTTTGGTTTGGTTTGGTTTGGTTTGGTTTGGTTTGGATTATNTAGEALVEVYFIE